MARSVAQRKAGITAARRRAGTERSTTTMPGRGQAARSPVPSRVLVVDDHPIFREGLKEIINQQDGLMVCGEAVDAASALASVAALEPNVVVVDVSLQESDGIELVKDLKVRHPKLPVLVLSMYAELLYAERALRAGARGYVSKQEPVTTVLAALRQVLGGEYYLSKQLGARLLNRAADGRRSGAVLSPLERLSDRELQVFRLLGRGHGTAQIAAELHVSLSTVDAHRAAIKRKLGLHPTGELLRAAVQWVERDEW